MIKNGDQKKGWENSLTPATRDAAQADPVRELLASTEEILSDEGIRRQCSEDLQAVWDKKD